MASKIAVGSTSYAAGNAPMKMGIAHELFSRHGLDVQMREYPRGADAMEALAAGEVDAAVVSALPIIRAASRGAKPVIIMSVENENIFAVIGARDVTSPKQLRGRTVGVSSMNDQDSLIIRRTLDAWGLHTGEGPTDVRIQQFPGGRGAIWKALLDGEVSAMAATVPEPINAESIGLPILHNYAHDHQPYQAGSLVTTRGFADNNRELLTDLVRAQTTSIDLFAADFSAAKGDLRDCTRIQDERVLKIVWELFGAAMKHGLPITAPLDAVIADVRKFDDPDLRVRASDIVDPSFFEAALVAQS